MAGGLLEYSGLVTKTKAMRARLLGADDYTAISEYESVTDFIAFLREQPAGGGDPGFAVYGLL